MDSGKKSLTMRQNYEQAMKKKHLKNFIMTQNILKIEVEVLAILLKNQKIQMNQMIQILLIIILILLQ